MKFTACFFIMYPRMQIKGSIKGEMQIKGSIDTDLPVISHVCELAYFLCFIRDSCGACFKYDAVFTHSSCNTSKLCADIFPGSIYCVCVCISFLQQYFQKSVLLMMFSLGDFVAATAW